MNEEYLEKCDQGLSKEKRPELHRYRSQDDHKRRYLRDHIDGQPACVDCGASENIQIHHQDGNIGNFAPSNLVALCEDCHRERHKAMKSSEHPVEGWKRAFNTMFGESGNSL